MKLSLSSIYYKIYNSLPVRKVQAFIWENFRPPYEKMDKEIVPLVRAIRKYVTTTGSCEGHYDHGCPYPWVDIPGRRRNVKGIERIRRDILPRFNENSDVEWQLEAEYGIPRFMRKSIPGYRLRPKNYETDLDTLKKSALKLAEFLEKQQK